MLEDIKKVERLTQDEMSAINRNLKIGWKILHISDVVNYSDSLEYKVALFILGTDDEDLPFEYHNGIRWEQRK